MKKMELEFGEYYWVRFRAAFHSQWVVARFAKGIYVQDRADVEWTIGPWMYAAADVSAINTVKIVRSDHENLIWYNDCLKS